MIIKIFVSFFVLFAFSRAVLRYRDKALTFVGLCIWFVIWGAVVFFVWYPKVSDRLAQSIGVGRGVDALVAISIVALFYGMFRIYIKMEFIEREITSLVREIANKQKK